MQSDGSHKILFHVTESPLRMMFGVRFLSVAAILIANGIGGFTAELSLTLLQDAVDKVLYGASYRLVALNTRCPRCSMFV